MSDIRVRHSDLVEFFRRPGMPRPASRPPTPGKSPPILAEVELRGIATHGAIRFPFYISAPATGRPEPEGEHAARIGLPAPAPCSMPTTAPGQLAGTRGMELAIEKARTCGVGFVAVKNSDHFGASGSYAMQAGLEQDMIGMVWSNGFSVMACLGRIRQQHHQRAAGLRDSRGHRTNRSCSTSRSARWRAARSGWPPRRARRSRRIGCSTSTASSPTTPTICRTADRCWRQPGTRGYGLAVVCEVLNGVLTGSPFLTDIPLWFANPTVHSRTAHTFLALDISKIPRPGPVQGRRGPGDRPPEVRRRPWKASTRCWFRAKSNSAARRPICATASPISEPVVADLVSLGKGTGHSGSRRLGIGHAETFGRNE